MSPFTATAALLLLLGCTHAGASQPPQRKVLTLTLPRAMAANDLVRAIVTRGPLPEGARMIARLPDGEAVGTIFPYVPPGGDEGDRHTMAIPKHGVQGDKVTLHFEVLEEGGASRAPTDRELRKVELHLIPSR